MTVMIGSIASVMSSTIVNVAVPDLMQHFAIGQERAQWVAAGFMAAMTLSMLTTPWLLARYGYRHTYIGAVLLLMAGGIVGGLAQHYPLVLAMRVAEGLAAGVLQVIPSIIILRAFGAGERGRAMGIFGFGVVLAPAIGPSVGGVLVEHFGWRSIFFLVVPFALWALLAGAALPAGVGARRRARRAGAASRWTGSGLVLAAVGVVGLLNGLVHLHDASPLSAAALLAPGVVALALFVWHESRTAQAAAEPAAVPLAALRHGRRGRLHLRHGPVRLDLPGAGVHADGTALPAVAGRRGAAAGRPRAGADHPARRPAGGPHSRRTCWWLGGLALLALSFALMATVSPATALWVLMLWTVVGRIGLGFVLPSLTLGAMPGLGADAMPQAASVISFLRQLGGAIGVSLVGILLEWRLRMHAAAGEAALAGFADTFWLVAALSALATLAALRMRPPHAERPHTGS